MQNTPICTALFCKKNVIKIIFLNHATKIEQKGIVFWPRLWLFILLFFFPLLYIHKYLRNAPFILYLHKELFFSLEEWSIFGYIYPLGTGNIISSHLRKWKCPIYIITHTGDDGAKRHEFWSCFLLFILLFFYPLFFRREEKRGIE